MIREGGGARLVPRDGRPDRSVLGHMGASGGELRSGGEERDVTVFRLGKKSAEVILLLVGWTATIGIHQPLFLKRFPNLVGHFVSRSLWA